MEVFKSLESLGVEGIDWISAQVKLFEVCECFKKAFRQVFDEIVTQIELFGLCEWFQHFGIEDEDSQPFKVNGHGFSVFKPGSWAGGDFCYHILIFFFTNVS